MPMMNRNAAGSQEHAARDGKPAGAATRDTGRILQDDRAHERQHPALPYLRTKDTLPLRVRVGRAFFTPQQGAAGCRADHAAEEHADQQDHTPA